ncbi:MAG: hypothetical protein Q7T71_11890, partial [Herbiconiux sp.]|nr:hypothetical protein [Herbiconiux sp.]
MSGDEAVVRARDRADDRRTTLLTFGVVLSIFAVGVSVQSVFVLGILPRTMLGTPAPAEVTLNLVVRLTANAGAVAAGLLGVLLLAPQERRAGGRLLAGAALALVAAL